MVLLLVIRLMLARENRRRDCEPKDTTYDDVFIEIMLADGSRVERKVEKVRGTIYERGCRYANARNAKTQEYLDLTDIQNRDFRYVL